MDVGVFVWFDLVIGDGVGFVIIGVVLSCYEEGL